MANPLNCYPMNLPANAKVVFLFDVDNTLLDNDGVVADLRRIYEF
jgi:hypothetical protein